MWDVRINETKLSSGNAIIVELFALWGAKKSKYDERTLFWGSPWNSHLSHNP